MKQTESGLDERVTAELPQAGGLNQPQSKVALEDRHLAALRAAVSIIWTTDGSGAFVEPQPMWEAFTGQKWPDHQGFGWAAMIHPEDQQRIKSEWLEAVAAHAPHNSSGRVWHAGSASYRHFIVRAIPVAAADGSIAEWIGTITDVQSDRDALERSEEEARRSAALLSQVLESAADPIWMRDADGVFRVANAAAAAVMGLDGDAVIGRSMHDIWPAHIAGKMQKQSDAIFDSREPLAVEERMPDAGKGGTRTYLSNKVPLFHDDGSRMGILGVSRDITERKRAEDELRASEARLATQIAELKALYDSAPIGLAFFSRDYRYLRINEELATINGVPVEQHVGRTIREVLSDNAPPVEPIIDRIFETGEAMRDLEISGETPHQPGMMRHWLAGFYPVKNEAGAVEAVGAWVIEISERKAAEQRELLLAREVDHRAKNLLTVVQSVMQLTRADSVAELKQSVIGRIQSLARAHALLANSRWEGVELSQLVKEELAPFTDNELRRATIEGPQQMLRPAVAQSLALVLHELATNAVKYGALSAADGRIGIKWEVSGEPPTLVLDWIEHATIPIVEPTEAGFGTRIISASVERQLQGRVTQTWNPDGLHCRLEFKLRSGTAPSEG